MTLKVPANGYALVVLTNESKDEAYFDELNLVHTRSRLLEEAHYYPDGLKMAGISSLAFDRPYVKQGYQGDFADYEEDYGYNEFALRDYDPQLGRWMSCDPYDQFASPYVGMGNDWANNVDPDGGSIESLLTNMFIGAVVGTVSGAVVGVASGDEENLHKYMIGGAIAGMAAGAAIDIAGLDLGQALKIAGSWAVDVGEVIATNHSERSFINQASGCDCPAGPVGSSVTSRYVSNENVDQVRQRIPKTINNTEEALDHYYNGNGEDVNLGQQTINEIWQSETMKDWRDRIIQGRSRAMAGNRAVNLTSKTFHAGRTNVSVRIICDKKTCIASFKLFDGDGFWDPNFVAEYYNGLMEKLGRGDPSRVPDGKGPNLERPVGTPYGYIPKVLHIRFANPGYPVNTNYTIRP